MTRITGEIVIEAPADAVFDFVADQRNEPAYNPHMMRSAKVTPGPVGKGRLDGPPGPLSDAGEIPLRRDRGPPVFGHQTRCRDAYSAEALIAERSRPADGRSRAYPPPWRQWRLPGIAVRPVPEWALCALPQISARRVYGDQGGQALWAQLVVQLAGSRP